MEIKTLNQLDYPEASKALTNIINSKLNLSEINEILNLDSKTIIGDFLEKYDKFSRDELKTMESYINKHYNHGDLMFVSDLIDFANSWGLNIDYTLYLPLLKKNSKEYGLVVLSLILYIQNNFNYYYFREVKDIFKGILNDSKYFQNAQISAAICLYRHTHKTKYIKEIEGWMDNDSNIEFINNIFNNELYKGEFFSQKRKAKILKILKNDVK